MNPLDAYMERINSPPNPTPVSQESNPLDKLLEDNKTTEIGPNGPYQQHVPTTTLGAVGHGIIDPLVEGAGNVATLISDPARALAALKTGVPNAIEGAGSMLAHPIDTAKMILWDGIVKPILINPLEIAFTNVTPEEAYQKTRETTVAVGSFAVGYGVGKAVGALGKVSEIAAKLRSGVKIASLEDAAAVGAGIAGDGGTAIVAKSAVEGTSMASLMKQWTAGAVTAGVTAGVLGAKTPEEAIQNAFTMGIFEGLLGPIAGAAHYGLKKLKAPVIDKIINVAKASTLDQQKQMLVQHGGLPAIADLMEGVNPVRVVSKYLPENEGKIITNAPDFDESPTVIKRQNNNGLYDALVIGNSENIKETQKQIPLGKKFENPNNPNMFAVLTKNTKPGEKPYRVSYFTKDDKGAVSSYVHNTFDTPEEATAWVTQKTEVPGDKLQGYVETGEQKPVSGPPTLPKSDIAFWKANGFLQNQVVQYKGREYQLLRRENQFAVLRELNTGNEKKAMFKSLTHPEKLEMVHESGRELLPFAIRDYSEFTNKADLLDVIKESPEDYAAYKKNVAEFQTKFEGEADKAVTNVAQYGYHFQDANDGNIILRNKDGAIVAVARNFKEATEIAANASNLDPTGLDPKVPGGVDGGGWGTLSADMDPARTSDHYGRLEWLRDEANMHFPALSTPYAYFTTLHKRIGKDFFNNVFLPLQKAKMKYQAALKPWADRLNLELAPMAKYTAEQRNHLFNAIQAFSAKEIMEDRPTILSRALNDNEKRLGEVLSKHSTVADRDVVYRYLMAQKHLEQELKFNRIDQAGFDTQKAALLKELTPTQLQVHGIFDDVLQERMANTSLYAINRLADAMETGALSRDEYIKQHGVDESLVKRIDKIYADLAPQFGISEAQRLGGYITHMWKRDFGVKDGGLLIYDKHIRQSDVEFAYGLPRIGAHKDLVTDPAEVLSRYLMHGMKVQHLYPEVSRTINWTKDNLQGVDGRAAESISRRTMDYVNEIRGFRNNEDAYIVHGDVKYTEDVLSKVMAKVGLDKLEGKDWIRTYLKVSEVATQGFKPIAGMRDATSFLMHYFARFGLSRTASMMKLTNAAFKSREALESAGKIPSLNVDIYNTLEHLEKKSSILDVMAEKGFKYSGQPMVFALSHAMTYLESKVNTTEALTQFVNKKMSREQFTKKINLDSFDRPVVERFNHLVDNGKFMDAVEYLGDITGREMVGYYGIANHPFFMQTKMGKLLGQHGQWPLWMMQNFGRMASRGTKAQRTLTWMKIGAMVGAMGIVGNQMDLNLKNWYLDPTNAMFAGGPVAQTIFNGILSLSNYEPTAEYGQQQLKNMLPFGYSFKNEEAFTNFSRPQFYLPIPSQAYNIIEAWRRAGQGDPYHIVGARLLGIRASSEYGKPQ